MALTTCKDCGGEISTEAKACPKCGRPSASPKPTGGSAGVVLLLILAAAGVWSLRSIYRAMTGQDKIGKTCTLQISVTFEPGSNVEVPLLPDGDAAVRAYGAGLGGRLTEDRLRGARWVKEGTSVRIEEVKGGAYRVTAPFASGWVAQGLCRR